MKWIIYLLIGAFFMSAIPTTAKACDIEFKIVKGKKDSYQVGDTLVVIAEVGLTHRTCPVKLKETKFKMKGLKVIKSTSWKEVSTNIWQRKLMIVVQETSNGKINISAIRECEKDGGLGTLKLEED